MNLTAYLPHIGARVWAIIRNEHITYDSGKMDVKDLRGADKMDPGNYKGGIGALRAFVAGCAAERGFDSGGRSEVPWDIAALASKAEGGGKSVVLCSHVVYR